MTAKQALILDILRQHPKGLFGLDIVRLSNGKLGRGTVYLSLGRLEEQGLVKSRLVPHPHVPMGRPLYTITRGGHRASIRPEGMEPVPV